MSAFGGKAKFAVTETRLITTTIYSRTRQCHKDVIDGRPLLHVIALREMNSLSVIFTANQKAPNEILFSDNLQSCRAKRGGSIGRAFRLCESDCALFAHECQQRRGC
jgi:hypothetical protein